MIELFALNQSLIMALTYAGELHGNRLEKEEVGLDWNTENVFRFLREIKRVQACIFPQLNDVAHGTIAV